MEIFLSPLVENIMYTFLSCFITFKSIHFSQMVKFMFMKCWFYCYCFLNFLVRLNIFIIIGPYKFVIICPLLSHDFFFLLLIDLGFKKIWRDIDLGISYMLKWLFPKFSFDFGFLST